MICKKSEWFHRNASMCKRFRHLMFISGWEGFACVIYMDFETIVSLRLETLSDAAPPKTQPIFGITIIIIVYFLSRV